MNMRRNMLAAALLVAMGASAPAWAGNTCTLLDIAGVTGNGGSSTVLTAPYSTACGVENQASGDYSNAFGSFNYANGNYGNAFGSFNYANGHSSNAYGWRNRADGDFSSAFGTNSSTGSDADFSIAFGAGDFLNPMNRGANVAAGVTSAIAIGHTVHVGASDGVAIGHNTAINAGAVGAVALGSDAIATEADTFSVGHVATDIDPDTYVPYGSALNRRIVNVANGQADTDAVNVRQMQSYVTSQAGSASPWFTGTGDSAITDGSDYPQATGTYSLAAGSHSMTSGDNASAYGYYSQAVGNNSLAVGGWYDLNVDGTVDILDKGDGDFRSLSEVAYAAGASAVAVGNAVYAGGDKSVAVGVLNQVYADYGNALGFGNVVGQSSGGSRMTAVGYSNLVQDGNNTSAFGVHNRVTGTSSMALGVGNASIGESSIAIGQFSHAGGESSMAIGTCLGCATAGDGARADGDRAIAVGNAVSVVADSSIAIGISNGVKNNNSLAVGINNSIKAYDTVYNDVIGGDTVVGHDNSITSVHFGTNDSTDNNVFGAGNTIGALHGLDGSILGGKRSNAFGYNNTVNLGNSTAVGINNTIDIGPLPSVQGFDGYSNAFGNGNTLSSGNVFGTDNAVVSGQVFGSNNVLDSVSYSNVAVGVGNTVSGDSSSVLGVIGTVGDGADHALVLSAGTAVGATDGASVAVNIDNAIAIGRNVSVNANDGVAMGHNAVVNTGAVGAAALGSDAIATQANTLSVGHAATDINPATNAEYGSALNRRIVNVASGAVTPTSTDAINGSQLYDVQQTASAGWNVGINEGTTVQVKPGDNVDFSNTDSNIEIAKTDSDTDHDITVDLADDIDVTSVAAGNSTLSGNGLFVTDDSGRETYVSAGEITVTGDSGASIEIDGGIGVVEGLTNTTWDPNNVTSDQAATEGQLSDLGTLINKRISNITDASGIINAVWNLTAQGANSSTVDPKDTVDLNNGDGNIVVSKTATSNDVTFDLADDIAVDSVTTGNSTLDTNGLTVVDAGGNTTATGATGTSVTDVAGHTTTVASTGTTVIDGAGNSVATTATGTTMTDGTNTATYNADGLVITGGPAVSSAGIDAGKLKITGVADGDVSDTSTDAVNGSQLYAVSQQVTGNTTAITGNTTAITTNTTAITTNTTAITTNTTAITTNTTAITGNTEAIATNTTAITGNTEAIATNTTAITTNTTAINQLQQDTASLGYFAVDGKGDGSDAASVKAGGHGVAIGSNAHAGGDHGTAIGGDSYAAGPGDTALGGNARVHADGSTAVGANTRVAKAATNAVAVGESATVEVASGTAVGQGASVTAANAVALGQDSVADQADTVSVGSAGHERRVVNVAKGQAVTDAVNKGQLDAVTAQAVEDAKQYARTGDTQTLRQANAYTDQQIQAALGGDMATFRRNVDDRFHRVDRRMDRMNAMRSAATQMAINAAGAQGNGRLAVGVGFSSGESALSVGYGAPLGKRFHVSFGATASGSETSAGVGFGVDL